MLQLKPHIKNAEKKKNVSLVSLGKHTPFLTASLSLCAQVLAWRSSLLPWSLRVDLFSSEALIWRGRFPSSPPGPDPADSPWLSCLGNVCSNPCNSRLSGCFFPRAGLGWELLSFPWGKAAEQPRPAGSLPPQSKAFTLFYIFISRLKEGTQEENKIVIAADVIFTIYHFSFSAV